VRRLPADLEDLRRVRAGPLRFPEFPAVVDQSPKPRRQREAAECAGELGAYWQMHELLFGRRTSGQAVPMQSRLKAFSKELKLDSGPVDGCLDGGSTRQGGADQQEGIQAGVTRHPAFPTQRRFSIRSSAFTAFRRRSTTTWQVGSRPRWRWKRCSELGSLKRRWSSPFSTFNDRPAERSPLRWSLSWSSAMWILARRVCLSRFPLSSLHPFAQKAAESASVPGTRQVLEMHEKLMTAEEWFAEGADSAQLFKTYAKELGLETGAFNQCWIQARPLPRSRVICSPENRPE